MQAAKHENLVAVRLFSGEDLHESLAEVCREHDVETAVVLSGLGQLKDFELGYFKRKGDYDPEYYEGPHELLNLTGTISRQGDEYLFHLHATLAGEGKNAIGGHLIKAKAQVTNEIFLLATSMEISRRTDENTGLKGLFLD